MILEKLEGLRRGYVIHVLVTADFERSIALEVKIGLARIFKSLRKDVEAPNARHWYSIQPICIRRLGRRRGYAK